MTTSTTTREYLKTQGIAVGKRGRFSGAALGVISKAVQEGVVFSDTKNAKQQTKCGDPPLVGNGKGEGPRFIYKCQWSMV